MCPNIEDYAPLISATFGLDDDENATNRHPGHRLRVRLADRSLRQTNPLLATIGALLDLAAGRVTASKVLDLAASAPVSRRFRFDDDDLERLQAWVTASGIRWGLDAEHRKPFGLEQLPQNTWRAGLDRILLGAAMAEDDQSWVGLALPLDDVDSTDIDLAGRFAELIDRVTAVLDDMVGDRPLSRLAGHPAIRARQPHRRPLRRRLAEGAGQLRALGHRHRGRRPRDPDRAVDRRRPCPAHRPAGRPPDPRELPHRQPHDVLDGADAVGAAPGRLPARPGRRRVPAHDRRRRRRHPRPRPVRRRARPAQRGPAAAARRRPRGQGAPRRPLHRRRSADQRPAPARRTAGRDPRRRRQPRAARRRQRGARPRRRPPSAAAVRRAQLHRRRPRHRRPVQLRPPRACGEPNAPARRARNAAR